MMNNKTKKYAEICMGIIPDPLWEKYYDWSPYHYSGNSPVIAKDGNGRLLINANLSLTQMQNFNASVQFLYSLNSPIIISIIKIAKGEKSTIYLNTFNRPAKTKTKSHVGRSKPIEQEWNSTTGIGMTVKSPKKGDLKADVVIMKSNLNNTGSGNSFNPYETVAAILDELNHAIQLNESLTSKAQHQSLYNLIKGEIDAGIFDNKNAKFFIERFLLTQLNPKNK